MDDEGQKEKAESEYGDVYTKIYGKVDVIMKWEVEDGVPKHC